MSLITTAIRAVERLPLPDSFTLAGIDYLVGRTGNRLERDDDAIDHAFAEDMANFPIAQYTDEANTQHYELPPEFFALALGPQRKYSSCLFTADDTTLAEAETRALAATAKHAALADGQRILELGCGWGSLTLWMAAHYPNASVTAVSNSASQRAYIEAEARARSLANVEIITADMNAFAPEGHFDRVVSVEMFEHMANWRALLTRVRGWLKPEGLLFLHVFTHRTTPYRFDPADEADWIAQHFFTGGIMPSHRLIRQFPDLFELVEEWRWNGRHYARTAQAWLENFDRNRVAIDRILEGVYGADAGLWRRRWRLFFLATAGLFGHGRGEPWGVSHYRLRPVA